MDSAKVAEIITRLHYEFGHMVFYDEGHVYVNSITGNTYRSQSDFIGQYCPKFDAEAKASDPQYQLKTGLAKEQILKQWDTKRDGSGEYGTSVHAYMQNFMFRRRGVAPNAAVEVCANAVWDMYTTHEIVPIVPEMIVASDAHEVAGQIDLVSYWVKRNGFLLSDWKTNEDMYKKPFKNELKLLGPLKHLDNTKVNKYALQLSFYRYLLELMFDGIVFAKNKDGSEMAGILHWMPKGVAKVTHIPLPYYKDEIAALL